MGWAETVAEIIGFRVEVVWIWQLRSARGARRRKGGLVTVCHGLAFLQSIDPQLAYILEIQE
jgi:hypothetical protein